MGDIRQDQASGDDSACRPGRTLDEVLKVHAEALGIETLEVEVMKVYSFSEARQNFAAVLDNAQKEGAVRIMRRDGRIFIIQPVGDSSSPLAVEAVPLDLSQREIVSAVREGRERD